jgi:hypothetical protein
MPNKRDYNNSKIYIIKSHKTKNVYIGSTTQTIGRRLIDHRTKFNQYKNGTNKTCNYLTSFEIIKYGDAFIQLVEEFPCNCKKELEKRECEIIEVTPNAVNINFYLE